MFLLPAAHKQEEKDIPTEYNSLPGVFYQGGKEKGTELSPG